MEQLVYFSRLQMQYAIKNGDTKRVNAWPFSVREIFLLSILSHKVIIWSLEITVSVMVVITHLSLIAAHFRRQHWKSISFQYREVNSGFVPSGCSIWISKMWKQSSVTRTRMSGPYHFALYLLAHHLHNILYLIH